MHYFLYKLEFLTAVHFGQSDSALSLYTSMNHFYADTLFSALCHTAVSMFGEAGAEELCRQVRDNELLLSDSMPWKEDDYYLPKPLTTYENGSMTTSKQRKAIKRLEWVPVKAMNEFIDYVHGGPEYKIEKYELSLGCYTEVTRAKCAEGEDTLPYQVGVYYYEKDCGLYFIAGMESEEQKSKFDILMEALGWSGIGGKTSSGCGRFKIREIVNLNKAEGEQEKWLMKRLQQNSGTIMLLTTSIPSEDEFAAMKENLLEQACYQVIRRGGFVNTGRTETSNYKKKVQFFFQAGSTFAKPFQGDLFQMADRVFRYSKPIYLEVSI